MNKKLTIGLCGLFLASMLSGCSAINMGELAGNGEKTASAKTPKEIKQQFDAAKEQLVQEQTQNSQQQASENKTATPPQSQQQTDVKQAGTPSQNGEAITVVAQPEAISVLVNKYFKLPDNYNPHDLVTTNIPFLTSASAEKRQLRSEAAQAIAELFAGAKAQGINLLGVSGYRSHATQVSLFNHYVQQDGYEKARTYSALPGTSEHETGLSIDVTGGDGRCPAEDCFGGTAEAAWLQDHVADYGFIIRYPNGKDAITGYKYEPWHIRYVGKAIASEIMKHGSTLEEYFNAVPVNK